MDAQPHSPESDSVRATATRATRMWRLGLRTHIVTLQPAIHSSVAYSESALWQWLQGQSSWSASAAPSQSLF